MFVVKQQSDCVSVTPLHHVVVLLQSVRFQSYCGAFGGVHPEFGKFNFDRQSLGGTE